MPEITIRRGEKTDITRLVGLSQTWCVKAEDKKRAMLDKCFELSNYILYVAECDNAVVGWLSAYMRMSWVNAEKRLFVGSVFVHPYYRKRGIMRMLWNKIETTQDYDIAFIDTRMDYPVHLGFELGACKLYIKRREKSS